MITNCKACKLHLTRRNIVVGRGQIPADILFIGEGPGKSEDVLSEAFVGPSGKLLNLMLERADIKKSYYITNCVLCRPCDSKGGDNRAPSPDEILACRKNIFRIIEAVKPRHVILLGKVAKRYFGKDFPFATCLTHPAALLRDGGISSPDFLRNIRLLEEALV